VREAAERWYRVQAEFIPEKLKNGRAALRAWIRGLELHETLAAKVDPGRLLFYNLWAYKHLYDARRAAARFLREHAATYPTAQDALLQAAGLYQQEADLLGAAYDDPGTYVGSFEDLGACIGPSGYEDTDATQWTPKMRQRERKMLGDALTLERAAVEAMGEALAGMS
jgi:hypothetical protein